MFALCCTADVLHDIHKRLQCGVIFRTQKGTYCIQSLIDDTKVQARTEEVLTKQKSALGGSSQMMEQSIHG
jgi:hypothetical protein